MARHTQKRGVLPLQWYGQAEELSPLQTGCLRDVHGRIPDPALFFWDDAHPRRVRAVAGGTLRCIPSPWRPSLERHVDLPLPRYI